MSELEVTVLRRQLAVTCWPGVMVDRPKGITITLPEGTVLRPVIDNGQVQYAVDDIDLLVRLTGNDHDPQYRYVYVPTEEVKKEVLGWRAVVKKSIAEGGLVGINMTDTHPAYWVGTCSALIEAKDGWGLLVLQMPYNTVTLRTDRIYSVTPHDPSPAGG